MGLPVVEGIFKIKNDKLVMKPFVGGFQGRILGIVRHRNHDNLETAISYVIEEEHFVLTQKNK